MGQAAREFAELSFCGVDMEELTSVRTVFYFGDLALPAGEFDVVADLEVRHSPIRPANASSISSLSSSDTP